MLKRFFHACLMATVVCSCTKTTQQSPYIDTRAFFEEQISTLKQQQVAVEKHLAFGNRQEQLVNKAVDWDKELSSFKEIDMRKPSYNGRYTIDTISNKDTGYKIRYRSADPKTDLREVIVGCADGRIQSVMAFYNKANSLYLAGKTLVYCADSGYSVTGSQEVKLGNAIDYSAGGRFIKP